MMNNGVCIRLLLLLVILFALGNPNEACCGHQPRITSPPPDITDTTPPQYINEFAVCNEKSSTKNYGKFVDVEPIKKFWSKPEAKDEKSEPVYIEEPDLPNEFGTGVYEYTYRARDSAPSPNINTCKIQFEVQVKTCPVLSNPNNGYHNCHRRIYNLDVGTTCSYWCKEGYNLQGAPELKCHGTSDGRSATVAWVPQPEPTCTLITCDPLEDPLYGTVSCTRRKEYSSICSYKCDEGYDLGPGVASNLTCRSSGWSAKPVLKCKVITCDPLEDPLYGTVSCTRRNEYSSICSYKCDEGYDLGPGVASNLTCRSSGWSARPVLECKELKWYELITPQYVLVTALVALMAAWLVKHLMI